MTLLDDLATIRKAGLLGTFGGRGGLALVQQIVLGSPRTHLIIAAHAARKPNEPALVYEDAVTTWSGLLERVRRLSNYFIERGIGRGDGVAIMTPNRPEFLETVAAGLRIGALVGFVNPRAPSDEASDLLRRTGSRVVVTHRDDIGGDVEVLSVGEPYENALARSGAGEPSVPRGVHGRIVVFTSGTTGRPKGAVRSLEQAGSLGMLAGFLRTIPFTAADVHMVVCPLYHSSGSGFASIAQGLGNTTVIVPRFSPQAFCETVQRHKVTTTVVVPTMLHQITEWADAKNYDLSSLRIVVCTGAALREEVRRAGRELLGDVLYDLYGSTEMAWVSIATPDDQRKAPGTVGKPAPGVAIKILDSDGNVLPQGEPGEVWAGSEALMEGYLDDPELAKERMREGFVSVRDVGFLDDDGYLHVVDRADDMIISGGVNVYPAETEIALGEHPKVSEASVVGVPDPKWGQRIVAMVVPREQIDPDELLAWTKDRVAYAAVPKEVRFAEALPRNDVGKVDKKRIVAEW